MRFDWDDDKSETVAKKRGWRFDEILPLFATDFYEELNPGYDKQFLIIGFLDIEMITIPIEYREDDDGEFIWIITYWKSTQDERRRYAERKR